MVKIAGPQDREVSISASSVRRLGLADQISGELTRMIVEGSVPPGTLLPTEQALARRFGVGKSAIREAVRVLSTKGLVEVVQGSGMRVADTHRWNVIDAELVTLMAKRGLTMDELIEVRRTLEPDIVGLAAERATADELGAMGEAVARTAAYERGDPEYIHLDVGFHNQVATATHNPIYAILVGSVFDLLVESRRLLVDVPGATTRGIYHHQRILEALRARDPHEARARMIAHLDQVADDWRGHSPGT
jgi:GntR family transcriptional regulator, transcriptional repressor for pyruvate dehydrogenase complex